MFCSISTFYNSILIYSCISSPIKSSSSPSLSTLGAYWIADFEKANSISLLTIKLGAPSYSKSRPWFPSPPYAPVYCAFFSIIIFYCYLWRNFIMLDFLAIILFENAAPLSAGLYFPVFYKFTRTKLFLSCYTPLFFITFLLFISYSCISYS